MRDERAERGERDLRANVEAARLAQRAYFIVLHDRDAAARLVLVADTERVVARICGARARTSRESNSNVSSSRTRSRVTRAASSEQCTERIPLLGRMR